MDTTSIYVNEDILNDLLVLEEDYDDFKFIDEFQIYSDVRSLIFEYQGKTYQANKKLSEYSASNVGGDNFDEWDTTCFEVKKVIKTIVTESWEIVN